MKILTAAEMREVDRLTMEAGIPGIVLMENAGLRVVEFLEEKFAPLDRHHVVILCGKGNNGGDGLVVARQLFTRFRPRRLDVVLLADPTQMQGDAAANLRMLEVCGCPIAREVAPEMRAATIVLDALMGTGLAGPAKGEMLEAIRTVNSGFPNARIVAVDIPSGMPSDCGEALGEAVRADYTVTFTAPKVSQIFPPNCELAGELRVARIGSPDQLMETARLALVEPAQFRHLFGRRPRSTHKGSFGHVLVVGGSRGKTGAAAMAGMAALRSGAGLVTVASAESALPAIASHAAELMTEPLPETDGGSISLSALDGRLQVVASGKDVLALGPGMGTEPQTAALVRRVFAEFRQPMVVDADGLNALAGTDWNCDGGRRVLTPHPGEMGRLAGKETAEIQADRVGAARELAAARGAIVVLKGYRTLIAFADGRVWVNPTGTPAMATGGTGDILTGLMAGLLAQFPGDPESAVAAAVYLHGLCGQLGAEELGEQPLVATDLLLYLPKAIQHCAGLSHQV